MIRVKSYNKRQHKQALRALDSQQVARLCGKRYVQEDIA